MKLTRAACWICLAGMSTAVVASRVEAAEAPISLTVTSAEVTERDLYQSTPAEFVASIGEPVDHDVTFRATTRNGTALAGSDYDFFTRVITIPAGETSTTIVADVLGDLVVEGDETFLLEVTDAGPAIDVTTPEVSGLIHDNDGAPLISVDDSQVTEQGHELETRSSGGNDRRANVVFRVNSFVAEPVVVSWQTVDGTAVAGDHYVGASGSFTFMPGRIVRSVKIDLAPNDQIAEPDRDFSVEITALSGPAGIGDPAGTVTIRDDDHVPTIIVSDDIEVVEGDADTTHVVVPVLLDRPSERRVRFRIGSIDGTAIGGQRYQEGRDFINWQNRVENRPATLTLYAGSISRRFEVEVRGDTEVEADEQFFVDAIGPFENSIGPAQPRTTITILNDD